jgi:hypothetical protein
MEKQIMKTDEELKSMMMVALHAAFIDYAGEDCEGKDDPHSIAIRLVREVIAELEA